MTNKNTASNDIENEFYSRFLSLFASYYDVPSTDPIVSFPPAQPTQKKDETQNKAKPVLTQPLTSGIWDVRLKRAVEKNQSEIEEKNNEINQKIDEDLEKLMLHSNCPMNKDELTDIFLPEKASRPEVPKYIQCFEAEKKKEEARQSPKRNCVNNSYALRQFNIRIKKQKQRSMEWKKRFQEKKREDERKHQEFLATLPKTERTTDKSMTHDIKSVIQEQKKFAKTLYEKRIEEGNKITQYNRERNPIRQKNQNSNNIEEEEEEDI